MFTCLAINLCAPEKYVNQFGISIKSNPPMSFWVGNVADVIVGIILLLFGLYGTELGLSPAAQYILIGIGSTMCFEKLMEFFSLIKDKIAPDSYLFKTERIDVIQTGTDEPFTGAPKD